MPSLEISLIFFATSLLMGIAPGPDIIFVLTQSALFGWRAGVFTTLGLVTGLCFHTLAVALGVAALFQTYPLLFNLLKCFGAGYLCWLAWLSFRAKASSADANGNGSASFPGCAALYRRGVIMNITNPKICMFFLAFLPQFCEPALRHMAWQIIYFGILFIIGTIIVFFAVSFMGGGFAIWFNKSPKIQIIIHRLAALVFLGLAAALVFTEGGLSQ